MSTPTVQARRCCHRPHVWLPVAALAVETCQLVTTAFDPDVWDESFQPAARAISYVRLNFPGVGLIAATALVCCVVLAAVTFTTMSKLVVPAQWTLSLATSVLYIPLVHSLTSLATCDSWSLSDIEAIQCGSAGHVVITSLAGVSFLTLWLHLVATRDSLDAASHEVARWDHIRHRVKYFDLIKLGYYTFVVICFEAVRMAIGSTAAQAAIATVALLVAVGAAVWHLHAQPFASWQLAVFASAMCFGAAWSFVCSLVAIASGGASGGHLAAQIMLVLVPLVLLVAVVWVLRFSESALKSHLDGETEASHAHLWDCSSKYLKVTVTETTALEISALSSSRGNSSMAESAITTGGTSVQSDTVVGASSRDTSPTVADDTIASEDADTDTAAAPASAGAPAASSTPQSKHTFDSSMNTVTFHRGRDRYWLEVQGGALPDDLASKVSMAGKRIISVHAEATGDAGIRQLNNMVMAGALGNDLLFSLRIKIKNGTASGAATATRSSGVSESKATEDPRLSGRHPSMRRTDVTTDGISMLASLLSQHSSAAFGARHVKLSGLYLTYESMTTIAYRIKRMPMLQSLDLGDNVFDETSAVNTVFMLRDHPALAALQLGQGNFSPATVQAIDDVLHRRLSKLQEATASGKVTADAADSRLPAAINASQDARTAEYVKYNVPDGPASSAFTATDAETPAAGETLSPFTHDLGLGGDSGGEVAAATGASAQSTSPDKDVASKQLSQPATAAVTMSTTVEPTPPAVAPPPDRESAQEPSYPAQAFAGSQRKVHHRATVHVARSSGKPKPPINPGLTDTQRLALAVRGTAASSDVTRRNLSAPVVGRRTTLSSNRMRSSLVSHLQQHLYDGFSKGGKHENQVTWHRSSYVDLEEESDEECGSDADDGAATAGETAPSKLSVLYMPTQSQLPPEPHIGLADASTPVAVPIVLKG